MDAHPDDVNAVDDLTLVQSARAGDRLAFGVLYLRHHAAAWRVACVASRFSPDAELAVIEGFTRVFSALPAESEEINAGGVTFRPYLLACVRQAALDRASAAGRSQVADAPAAQLAGLGPDGEVVLSSLEHHVARGALAALPERPRTALWLSDVEAMTPGEVAAILGGEPQEMPVLAAGARAEIHTVQQTSLGRQEVRAGCRFTVDHLDAYQAGTLDPTEGLIVRSHLTGCPPCRMRQGELSIAPAALAGAVPAAPLLGGEAQHHWLAAAADSRPAARLLPPVLAAGGTVPREPLARRTATRLGTAAGAAMTPARGLPDALRRAGRAAAGTWRSDADSIDLTTRPGPPRDPTAAEGWTGSPGWTGGPTPSLPPAWTIPPGRVTRKAADRRTDRRARRRSTAAGGLLTSAIALPAPAGCGAAPALTGRAIRSARAALPAMALAVSWVLVMMALPRLMMPETAPGPGGLALPAVQAYMPGFPGGGAKADSGPAAAGPPAGATASGWGSGESAASTADTRSESAATLGDEPAIGLVAAAATRPNGSIAPRPRTGRPPAPIGVLPAGPAVTVAATTTALPPVTLIPTTVTPPASATLATPIAPRSIDQPGSVTSEKPKAQKKPQAQKKPKAEKRDKPAAARPEKARRPDRPTKKPEPADRTKGSTRKESVPKLRLFSA